MRQCAFKKNSSFLQLAFEEKTFKIRFIWGVVFFLKYKMQLFCSFKNVFSNFPNDEKKKRKERCLGLYTHIQEQNSSSLHLTYLIRYLFFIESRSELLSHL